MSVHIGPFEPEALAAYSSCFVISDENVWRAHGAEFQSFGNAKIITPGEQSKSLLTWGSLQSWLAQSGADRSSVILAVGGGVVGDLAGFAAATYMRGISYINVATSLMAQLDSAVGGKTGIDLPEGKNLTGAFHDAVHVFCNPKHLETLPARHFSNGMAEAIKYGFALDSSLIGTISAEKEELKARALPALTSLVERCIGLKMDIVARDPKETSGDRAMLNFGHTVGHALEAALEYEGLLHGEAVMAGMCAEAEIGSRMGITPPGARGGLEAMAADWDLPVRIPGPQLVSKMMEAMQRDKKNRAGSINMVLLDGIGSCRLVGGVDAGLVREVLAQL